MLKIALLDENIRIESSDCRRYLREKIAHAKRVYEKEIEECLGVNVFDIIGRMVEVDRERRLDLEETIRYAEEMYDEHEDSVERVEVERGSSGRKKELRKTNHSTSGKKCSPYMLESEYLKKEVYTDE